MCYTPQVLVSPDSDDLFSGNEYNIDETLDNAYNVLCKDLTVYSSHFNLYTSRSVPEVINLTKSQSKRTTQLLRTSSLLDLSHARGGLSLDVKSPTRAPSISCSISPTSLDPNKTQHDSRENITGRLNISCYDLISTLGRGAYGTVLLSYRKGDPRCIPYAIKVLQKASIVLSGTQEINRELKTLTLIAQKRLAGFTFMQKLAESFQNDKYIFIVLEYHPTTLSHPDIARLFRLHSKQEFAALTASTSLPVTDVYKVFSKPIQSRKAVFAALQLLSAEIVIGLLFLHQVGIIHQDIKPSNILISKTGHVVIGDFGAATLLPLVSRDTGNAGEPIFGSVVLNPDDIVTFTPLYAAPELLERDTTGLLIYNERVDWWSFGVLLHELVTGTVPFQSHLNSKCVNEGRRSYGDSSLSFGPLEKLGVCYDDELDDAIALDQFLRALLLRDAAFRLFGASVKKHSFLEPLADKWEEIAALQHPPCPSLPTDCSGDDSSEFNACLRELTSYQTQEEITLPSGDWRMPEANSIGCIARTRYGHANESEHQPLLTSVTWFPRTTVSCNAELRSFHTHSYKVGFDLEFKGEQSSLLAFPSTASFRVCMPNSVQSDQDVHESELEPFPSSASVVGASTSEGSRENSYEHDASEPIFKFSAELSQHTIPHRETPIYSLYKSHFNDSGLHIPLTPPLIRKLLPNSDSGEISQYLVPCGEVVVHEDEQPEQDQPLDQFDIDDDSEPQNFPPEYFLPKSLAVLPQLVHKTCLTTDNWTFDERITLALLGAQTSPFPAPNVRRDRRLSNASTVTSLSEKIIKGTKRWLQRTAKFLRPRPNISQCTRYCRKETLA